MKTKTLHMPAVTVMTAAPLFAVLAACGWGSPGATGAEAAATVSSQGPAPAPTISASGVSAVGVWASDDGSLRLELRPDGTFTEDYNGKKAAYEGRYTVEAGALALRAASGASADGTVSADTVRISGKSLKRQE
ncbi:Atu4866 domain-containing protein [Kitasatospora sp. NPDC002040]|uniref:Atu4866 domain-containing protein n=1 Tax=Kitasatospora sp. NPDC002040 TaxID=3154661 RepID=UPI0033185CAF